MPFSRRLTFSLRTSMLLVPVVAAWLGWITHRARVQRDAVAAIRDFGGTVRFDWQFVDGTLTSGREPAAPRWLRRALGDEFFQEVVYVDLFDEDMNNGRFPRLRPMTQAVLAHLRWLPRLTRLHLEGDQATDEGLSNIVDLTGLEALTIWGAKELGDDGIAHLGRLKRLKCLMIENSRMTDLGLGRLKGLTKLERLILTGNQLTDEGLAQIEGLKELSCLCVGGGNITDAGLVHLAGLTNLEDLDIQRSEVSDRGLDHLKGLTKLRVISIVETKITDEGIKKLQEAVPSLKRVVR
jgi:Leucine-rich repeat (LRR) protein